jgi:YVTN family beta-propeller protein
MKNRRRSARAGSAAVLAGLVVVAGPAAGADPATGGGHARQAAASAPVTLSTISTGAVSLGAIAVDSRRGLVYSQTYSSNGLLVYHVATGTLTADAVSADVDNIVVAEKTGDVYIPDCFNSAGPTMVVVRGSAILGDVPFPSCGEDLTVDQATGLVYALGDGTVTVLNGTTVMATIPVGGDPLAVAVDPSDGLVYVVNDSSDGTVSVIKGTQVVATVPVGVHPEAVGVDPGTHTAYVVNQGFPGDASVSVLHGADAMPTATVPIGSMGSNQAYVTVNPRNHLAYVAVSYVHGSVEILRGGTLIATDAVGSHPSGIAVDPANGYVTVTSSDSSEVAVLQGTAVTQTFTVAGDQFPGGFDTRNGQSYIAVQNGPTGSIVDDLDILQTPTPAK